MIDRLGMITFQRCQNSAPAGFELTVDVATQFFTVAMRWIPNRAMSGNAHAIGAEVGSKQIRLFRLML